MEKQLTPLEIKTEEDMFDEEGNDAQVIFASK